MSNQFPPPPGSDAQAPMTWDQQTTPAGKRGRSGILVLTLVIVVAALATGGMWAYSRLSAGQQASRSMQVTLPYIHLPSSDWLNGYETVWTLEGAIDAAANGDYMVATFPDKSTPEAVEIVGYDISGNGEPQELWRKNISRRFVSEFWRDTTLYAREVNGTDGAKLYALDATTGSMNELKVSGSLFGKARYVSTTYFPSAYVACDVNKVGDNRTLFNVNVLRRSHTGCMGFDYEGKELWSLARTDVPETGGITLNIQTGETTILPTSDLMESMTPVVHSTPLETSSDSVFFSFFEEGSFVIRDLDGNELDSMPFDLLNGKDIDEAEMIILQAPPGTAPELLHSHFIDHENVWDRLVKYQYDWTDKTVTLTFPGAGEKTYSIDDWLYIVPSEEADLVAALALPTPPNPENQGGTGLVTLFAAPTQASFPEVSSQKPGLLPRGDLLIQLPGNAALRDPATSKLTAYMPKR